MTVYVDDPIHRYGRMIMCHMLADTREELFEMADKIGVARKWYQDFSKASSPHFDIAKSKRALAVAAGAVPIGRTDLGALLRRIRIEAAERKQLTGIHGWEPLGGSAEKNQDRGRKSEPPP